MAQLVEDQYTGLPEYDEYDEYAEFLKAKNNALSTLRDQNPDPMADNLEGAVFSISLDGSGNLVTLRVVNHDPLKLQHVPDGTRLTVGRKASTEELNVDDVRTALKKNEEGNYLSK